MTHLTSEPPEKFSGQFHSLYKHPRELQNSI